MKASVTRCMAMLVRAKAGSETWKEIVRRSNVGAAEALLETPNAEIDDEIVGRLLTNICALLNVSEHEACEAFGEYWVCVYLPTVYRSFWSRFRTSRQMVLAINEVHVEMTEPMESIRAPRFDYNWKNDKTLVVTYLSARGVRNLYVGMLRGIGKYFKENLRAYRISRNQIEVVFPT